MLPSTSPVKALLACSLSRPWNLPSFTVESTLSSLCSRSDSSLSLLPRCDSLPLHNLVFWKDGSVPFPFCKSSSGILANCSLCGTEATISFSAVCLTFPAEACAIIKLFAGLGNTNKSAASFFFSSLALALSSPPSFLLPRSLW